MHVIYFFWTMEQISIPFGFNVAIRRNLPASYFPNQIFELLPYHLVKFVIPKAVEFYSVQQTLADSRMNNETVLTPYLLWFLLPSSLEINAILTLSD